jgi:SSS family solute:Na+ symporter
VLLIVPTMAYFRLNDLSDVAVLAKEKAIPLELFPAASKEWFVEITATVLSWGLGYFGMPHVLTKFMGIRDVSQMYKSKWLGMSWQVVILAGSAAVGLIGIAFFPLGLSDPQQVFTTMVKELFHPLAAGFALCAIIAANLSTMDSQILCCATTISEDLYRRACRKSPSPKRLLFVSRCGVIFIAIVAFLLALNKDASLLKSVLFPWAGLGCTFGPLVILGLYSKSINKYGAGVGIIFGGLWSFFWPEIRPFVTHYDIDGIVLGFPISMLMIPLVSYFTNTKTLVKT